MTAAAAQMSRVGDRTPKLAETAPASPATRVPAKVAQFSPSGPGVISAMATMSLTSERVIQPWDSISLLIEGDHTQSAEAGKADLAEGPEQFKEDHERPPFPAMPDGQQPA